MAKGGDPFYREALELMSLEKPDVKEVKRLLEQAVAQDSEDAMYALGSWYLNGDHVNKDLDTAIKLLLKAADRGQSSALYDLAVCYENGEGFDRDVHKAFSLYLKAAIRGDAQSCHEVGRCYYYGIGVVQDRNIADIWLERAEEVGAE